MAELNNEQAVKYLKAIRDFVAFKAEGEYEARYKLFRELDQAAQDLGSLSNGHADVEPLKPTPIKRKYQKRQFRKPYERPIKNKPLDQIKEETEVAVNPWRSVETVPLGKTIVEFLTPTGLIRRGYARGNTLNNKGSVYCFRENYKGTFRGKYWRRVIDLQNQEESRAQ